MDRRYRIGYVVFVPASNSIAISSRLRSRSVTSRSPPHISTPHPRFPSHIKTNQNVHLPHRHLRPPGHRLRRSRPDREAPGFRYLRQRCTLDIPTSLSISKQNTSLNNPLLVLQSYSAGQVTSAVNQGCNLYQSGSQIGSNNYPHAYNNYEGFDFAVGGPWQEFPLTRGGYTGGEFFLLFPLLIGWASAPGNL